MGKSTISMAIFNSYVSLPKGNGMTIPNILAGITHNHQPTGIEQPLRGKLSMVISRGCDLSD